MMTNDDMILITKHKLFMFEYRNLLMEKIKSEDNSDKTLYHKALLDLLRIIHDILILDFEKEDNEEG